MAELCENIVVGCGDQVRRHDDTITPLHMYTVREGVPRMRNDERQLYEYALFDWLIYAVVSRSSRQRNMLIG